MNFFLAGGGPPQPAPSTCAHGLLLELFMLLLFLSSCARVEGAKEAVEAANGMLCAGWEGRSTVTGRKSAGTGSGGAVSPVPEKLFKDSV